VSSVYRVKIMYDFYYIRSVLSHLRQNDTYRHLSALAIVYDVDMLIVGTSAPGVTGVAEATRLVDLTVTAQGLIVVGADLATRIDLLVAELHANALSRALLRILKSKKFHFPFYSCLFRLKERTKFLFHISNPISIYFFYFHVWYLCPFQSRLILISIQFKLYIFHIFHIFHIFLILKTRKVS